MHITLQSRLSVIAGENDCYLRILQKPTLTQPVLTIQLSDQDNVMHLHFDRHDITELQTRLHTFLHTGAKRHSLNKNISPWRVELAPDSVLQVNYDNLGEPYREGFRFDIRLQGEDRAYAFFDDTALLELDQQLERIRWPDVPDVATASTTPTFQAWLDTFSPAAKRFVEREPERMMELLYQQLCQLQHQTNATTTNAPQPPGYAKERTYYTETPRLELRTDKVYNLEAIRAAINLFLAEHLFEDHYRCTVDKINLQGHEMTFTLHRLNEDGSVNTDFDFDENFELDDDFDAFCDILRRDAGLLSVGVPSWYYHK